MEVKKIEIPSYLYMDYIIKSIEKITKRYCDNVKLEQNENIIDVYYDKEIYIYNTITYEEDTYDPPSGWTTKSKKTKKVLDRKDIITQHLATFNIDLKNAVIYITIHDEDREQLYYYIKEDFMERIIFDYMLIERSGE